MSEHIVTPRTYWIVFITLIILTVLTVGLSFIDMGKWHTVLGGLIAISKGVLVVLFFMHLLYSPRMIWIIVGAGLFWMGIMLVLTIGDYIARHTIAY